MVAKRLQQIEQFFTHRNAKVTSELARNMPNRRVGLILAMAAGLSALGGGALEAQAQPKTAGPAIPKAPTTAAPARPVSSPTPAAPTTPRVARPAVVRAAKPKTKAAAPKAKRAVVKSKAAPKAKAVSTSTASRDRKSVV